MHCLFLMISIQDTQFHSISSFSFPFYDNIVYCRYADSALPTTFIGLEKWLQELWRDKDQLLETVYKGQAHHMFSQFLNLPIYEF